MISAFSAVAISLSDRDKSGIALNTHNKSGNNGAHGIKIN